MARLISVVILAVFLLLAVVMIGGKGEGLARLIANRISKKVRYDEDRITHALLFMSVVIVILEVLNIIFIESIIVPCVCMAVAAVTGFIAYRFVTGSGVRTRLVDVDKEDAGDTIENRESEST